MMKGIVQRARLYTALVLQAINWTACSAYRVATNSKHPLGWTPYQDWSIGLMRVLFRVGSYNHWRNSIKLMIGMSNGCDQHLTIIPIAPSTFKQHGFRDSYLISLPPEQQPANPKASFVLMYLHGGAFVAGDPLMYKPAYLTWMRQLAAQGIHMQVFAVGYPLAPEHTFPAALHGVAEAYQWLLRELGGSDKIILAGDSAGGNLTIAALAYMRDGCCTSTSSSTANLAASAATGKAEAPAGDRLESLQPPRAAILISPAVDFSSSSVFTKQPFQDNSSSSSSSNASLNSNFYWDYISRHENIDVMQLYISSHSAMELSHPLISPTYLSSFRGLVQREVLVVAGGCEAMTPDIVKFVEKMKAVSPEVPVTYYEEANEPHCYCMLSGMNHLIDKGTKVLLPFMERMLAD